MVTSDGRAVGRPEARTGLILSVDILDEGQPCRSVHRLLLLRSGIKRAALALE